MKNRKKAITGIALTVLLTGMLTLAFNVQPVSTFGAGSLQISVPDGHVYWNNGDFITTAFSSGETVTANFVTMNCLDDNTNDAGSETFEVAITTDSEGNNVIAGAQITNNFRNTGGCDAHKYSFDFGDVALTGGITYYLRTKVLAGAEVRTWLGATLQYDHDGGLLSYDKVVVPIPDGQIYWNDGDFITTAFSLPENGTAHLVTLRCLDDNWNDPGSETFEVAITTDPEGSSVITDAQITNNFRNTGGCDEHMYLFDFSDVPLTGDATYYIRTKVLTGATGGGGVRSWNWGTSDRNYLYYTAGAADHPWPMFHHDLSHTGYSTSTAPDTNEVSWSYTTDYDVASSPAVTDGKVYVGSRDGKVYCLDASTGAFIWSYQTGDWVESSPAVADGKVYVGSWDYNVYCLPQNDPNGDGVIESSEVIWTYTAGGYVTKSSPAVADGKVYVGTTTYPGGSDNKVYCLNASTGAFIWSYQTGGPVESSPAVANGKVYVGSRDDKVYCLPMNDPNDDGVIESSEVIWSYETWGDVSASPAVVSGRVYVGAEDGYVYCLDAEGNGDGTTDLIWKYLLERVRRSSPAVAYGKVYGITFTNGIVYCLDAEGNGDGTTDLIWSYTTDSYTSTSSPAVADGKVYVGSAYSNFYCLDAEGNGDGTTDLIWSYTTGGGVHSSPAVAEGKVYVGSDDDKVYAFGPPSVICGDVNNNGVVDVGDVVYLVTYLYKSGPAPVPMACVGDVTNNDVVDVGDVVYLVTYLYKSGPAPDPNCCNPSWRE